MSQIVPVFIPIKQDSPKCPKCKREEDIKRECRHCGYEYKEDEMTFLDGLFAFLFLCFCAWIFLTVIIWMVQSGDTPPYGGKTLLEMFKSQGEWIKGLKVW